MENNEVIANALAETIELLAVVAKETASIVSELPVDRQYVASQRNKGQSIRQKTDALLAVAAKLRSN